MLTSPPIDPADRRRARAKTPVVTRHTPLNSPMSSAEDEDEGHWSVFYPHGLECIAAPHLHYIHLGPWCTVPVAWDYFSHRRRRRNETAGHRVVWLHTARPRDRFVFVVDPVEARAARSFLTIVQQFFYGTPPCFAYKSTQGETSGLTPPVKPVGVEVIEVRHPHITAMDYAAGLTGNRLSIETQLASTKWFHDIHAALRYYECEDVIVSSPPDQTNGSFRMLALPPPVVADGPALARLADETVLHRNTMVTMYTQDPHFNAVLREMLIPEPGTCPFTASVSEQKRLLSLYEAGMPTWTIFVSKYGLPYRRWFRLVAVMIVNLWPLVAVCVGLYDLYKHMPYLREFLSDTLLPLQEWMDEHFTLRVSMLVTYLVTVSFSLVQSLHAFTKSVAAVVNFVVAPVVPLVQMLSLLRYPLQAAWMLVTFLFGPFFSIVGGAVATVQLFFSSAFGVFSLVLSWLTVPSSAAPIVQNASMMVRWWRAWLNLWDKVLRPVKNLAKAIYDGVVHVGVLAARREASIRRRYTTELRKLGRFFEASLDIFWFNWIIMRMLLTARMIVPMVTLSCVGSVTLIAWWFNVVDWLPLVLVRNLNPF